MNTVERFQRQVRGRATFPAATSWDLTPRPIRFRSSTSPGAEPGLPKVRCWRPNGYTAARVSSSSPRYWARLLCLKGQQMDISNLRGCGTALVTPFNEDLSIDEGALTRFVEFQISSGIDFLVPCGTTGESVTLGDQEQHRVVELVLRTAGGRVPVIAGAGSNN